MPKSFPGISEIKTIEVPPYKHIASIAVKITQQNKLCGLRFVGLVNIGNKPKEIFKEEWDTRGEWGEVKPTNNYEIVGLDLYYKSDNNREVSTLEKAVN